MFIMIGFENRIKAQSISDTLDAIEALQNSQFKEAEQLALKVLKRNPNNAQANLVAAITHYKRTMHDFMTDLFTIANSVWRGVVNRRYFRWSFTKTEQELTQVEKYLQQASKAPDVFLELSLAKWKVDWNRNGRIDFRDKLLFQIEMDGQGKSIPENDPRRTPTFRFDLGDIYWARAMIAFQRSFFNLVLAYKYPDLNLMELNKKINAKQSIVFKLKDKKLVLKAKKIILDGLFFADQSRLEYLAEKDDDREWLPNPNQKDHPIPLPVDKALYRTWKGILYDMRKLINGSEGLSVEEIAQLGDHQWQNPPRGYIHVGNLFEQPGDIVLNFSNLEKADRKKTKEGIEQILADIFGDKYLTTMKASRLPSRLLRMKREVSRGDETFERKMRYLFWLN